MRLFPRRAVGTDANEIASHAIMHYDGGRIAAVISAIALVFSAYSLWETSLKQADVSVYVTGVVSYGRDTSDSTDVQPSGGFEVLAVPVTIANGGARDAPILALHLDVSNPKTGLTARFEATCNHQRGERRLRHGAFLSSELQQRKGACADNQSGCLQRGAAQEVRQRNGRRQQHQHTA